MIEKMTKYSWILATSDADAFLAKIQELGVVDITRSSKAIDDKSAALLAEIDAVKSEISCLKKGSDGTLAALESELSALKAQAAELEPWGSFDPAAVADLASRGVTLTFYCIQQKKFDSACDQWAEVWAIQEICRKDGKVWFVIAGPAEGFPEKSIAAPQTSFAQVSELVEKKAAEADAYRASLAARACEIPSLERKMEAVKAEFNLYMASQTGESAAENAITVFEGFAPSSEDERLEKEFDTIGEFYLKEDACGEDTPPIKFRNNRFVKMFEVLTDMYGRPAYNGFDPTPFIAIFFLLFFAMCIGDMGYGLVLMVVGLLLRNTKAFGSLAPLVVTLGGGTVVVGFFFHTLFSVDFSTWECIPESLKALMVPAKIAGYDGTMVLALGVGIVHLLLAMIVKTVYATKNKGFLNSLSAWGWTLFWLGLVVIGAFALLGVLDSAVTKTAIIVLGIVCAIGIFPLNNLRRNPLVNIGSGLWDTYNMATGILGDVLSYLRLYALGLAGAMLGFAFNNLAGIALGDGGLGWVFFILIALVGHVLNLAMAALGAFVHPLRLNFLEFFKNSEYEATGTKYNPLKK